MTKFNKQEQKLLAIWASECAERVLPFFEKVYPKDKRPRKAIETCRIWIKTGIFKMEVIRKASLSAHAAARRVKDNNVACFAARAAGQAVATAHVPEHAFGAAYYAIKIAAEKSKSEIKKEINWQTRHLPKKLRKAWKTWQLERLPKRFKL